LPTVPPLRYTLAPFGSDCIKVVLTQLGNKIITAKITETICVIFLIFS